jgi:hypothetical protein
LACTAVLTVLAGVLGYRPHATATTVTSRIAPVADAYVSRARPDRNFGTSPTLHTDGFPKPERSYLRFDLSEVSGTVNNTTLRLYAETGSRTGFTVRTVPTAGWSEGTITYANAPTPGPVVAVSGPLTAEHWASVDVTDLAQGAGMVAIVLTGDDKATSLYASRETGQTAPQLVVVTTPATTSTGATTTSASTTTTRAPTTTSSTRTPTTRASTTTTAGTAARSSAPPPAGGYFSLASAGSWASLPSGTTCKGRIHASSWEPRPDNDKRNHVMVDPAAVHAAFAARPRAVGGAYDGRWDSWLLARVDGQFTGTTDEIFQWAACKWGLPDDLLRAIAVTESTWYQYLTYPSGRPVPNYGSGDVFSASSAASRVYCGFVARFGYDYQQDLGSGSCPQTFSIVGLKSWQDPAWGAWPDNQNGTFPFNRNSTAFAVDYLGGELRGCHEGWESWLKTTGTRGYAAGDLWGCVGSWYAGAWHTSDADNYIDQVRRALQTRPWLDSDWPEDKPGCTSSGCPGSDPL